MLCSDWACRARRQLGSCVEGVGEEAGEAPGARGKPCSVMRFQGSAGPQQLLPPPQRLLGSAIGSWAPRIKPAVGGGAGGCNLEPPGGPMWPPSASSITAPLPAGLPHLVPGPAVMGPLATSGGKQGAPVPLGWGGSGSPGRRSPPPCPWPGKLTLCPACLPTAARAPELMSFSPDLLEAEDGAQPLPH